MLTTCKNAQRQAKFINGITAFDHNIQLSRGKAEGKPSKNIVFVKEGTSLPKSQSKGQKNLMSKADDWKLEVDLNKKLVFPRGGFHERSQT